MISVEIEVNPFQANVPSSYPLKTCSGVIEREYWPEMGSLIRINLLNIKSETWRRLS